MAILAGIIDQRGAGLMPPAPLPMVILPLTWSESENINWKVKFPGQDLSSPVIKRSDKFQVLAVNTLDGKFDTFPNIVGDELVLKREVSLIALSSYERRRMCEIQSKAQYEDSFNI